MTAAPQPSPKLAGLDHLRALAISLVFLFHYRIFPHPEWLSDNAIGRFGWTGVDLFFVLSGYLITAQLVAEQAGTGTITLRTFFLKRFFRILPAYFVVVAVYFLVPAFHEREALSPLWRFLTFTKNFGLDLRTEGTFSHSWSLCVEEHFYLVLPLLLTGLAYAKAGRKAALLFPALAGAGLLIRWWSWQTLVATSPDAGYAWYEWVYYPTYNRLDGLLVGAAIACTFQFRPQLRDRLTRFGNGWLLLGVAVLTGAYFLCLEQDTLSATVFGFPLVALGYGALMLGAISPASILYTRSSTVTAKLATLSYAVYLSHKGLIHLTQLYGERLGVAIDSSLMMGLCVVVCGLGALLLHLLIERPFLRLREKVLHREPEPAQHVRVPA